MTVVEGTQEIELGRVGPTLRLRQCKLVILEGTERGREYVVASDVIRVGKSRENDLCLNEETVSRVHFEIVRDQKGYLVRDLRSTNGTFLDGSEIKEAYVRAGSVISAGAAQLQFTPFEERIEIEPHASGTLGDMVGESAVMRRLFSLLVRVAGTEATVLFEGEPGTGKRLAARTLHDLSPRKAGPFVVIDLAEGDRRASEAALFGCEKGSGPGAGEIVSAFERADGGTLALHNLTELALDLQPKLLRVLEQRELRRLGSARTVRVGARIVGLGSHELRRRVERGTFREDLYFRMSVVPALMPSLRERAEDIAPLVAHFLSGLGGAPTDAPPQPSAAALRSLSQHDWPGNVGELRNFVERALAEQGDLLSLVGGGADGEERGVPGLLKFDPTVPFRIHKERFTDQFERSYLTWLLRRAGGNVSKAARDADMDRKYLHKLLRHHQIGED